MASAEENPCRLLMKPSWAISHTNGELVLGAHLPTRDGRRTGNAHIIDIQPAPWSEDVPLFTVLTDAGTAIRLISGEVQAYFYPPEWVSDVQEVIKRFSRQ